MSEPEAQIELRILVIDDDPALLRSVGNYLKARGYRVYLAEGGTKGLDVLGREAVDIVITDIKMPDMDGFQVLREVRGRFPGIEVIMITAYGDIESAVRAMREGAFDFFSKPFKVEALNTALQRTVRFQTLRREKDRYRERLDRLDVEGRKRYGLSAIVGNSPGIRAVRDLIGQVSQADVTSVLICGKTGTGKELVARAIHYECFRSEGPFLAVDCSAIPESLFESAFYGHVKGAFTDARQAHKGYFEVAEGGTLFLDEISDMGLGMQAKLLRTLEERRIRPVGGTEEIPVDVQVVSATNRDLQQAISEGAFREDLYYRLNAFTIGVPALRERGEDILPLARHFLKQYARELRKPIQGFSPEAEAHLGGYPFPGNVRELRNLVERAVILCRNSQIELNDLRFEGPQLPNRVPETGQDEQAAQVETADSEACATTYFQRVIREARTEDLNFPSFEREIFLEALHRAGGNQVQAARILGISRHALRRRMARYGIQPSEFGGRN